MADHTVVGHQIVSSVQFPWPKVPEIVRWHHERTTAQAIQMLWPPMNYPCRCASWGSPILRRMTSIRPYPQPYSVGAALSELVRMARRNTIQCCACVADSDAPRRHRQQSYALVGRPHDGEHRGSDIDHLAATLQHKVFTWEALSDVAGL